MANKIWRENNLESVEDLSVWFRMKLRTIAGIKSAYIYSPAFHVDNNAPPIASNVQPIFEEQQDDIIFQFLSEDAENDPLTITNSYSLDQGNTWEPGTLEHLGSEGLGRRFCLHKCCSIFCLFRRKQSACRNPAYRASSVSECFNHFFMDKDSRWT